MFEKVSVKWAEMYIQNILGINQLIKNRSVHTKYRVNTILID